MTRSMILTLCALALLLPSQAQAASGRSGETAATVGAQYSMLSTIGDVAKCALHIAGFVVGNAVAISKLRKAGGVWRVARRVWNAKGKTGKLKVLTSALGEIIGLNQVVEACS